MAPLSPDPSSTKIHIYHRSSFTLDADKLFAFVVGIGAVSGLIVLVWIAWIVYHDARPAIDAFGLGFLTEQTWDVPNLKFGGLPYILGTLISSFLGLVIAIPIGVAAAIATSEDFFPTWVRLPLASTIEIIASIPSVIVGLWGIFIVIPLLTPVQEWLYEHFNKVPIFSTPPLGPSVLIAGVILAIMILPTIASVSREVLLAIPEDLKFASRALGATRWEIIIWILLPAASSGILGSIILALGRALGETMAVTMVIGNSTLITPSLLAPGYTIPAVLANQFSEALDDLHIGALMYLALILFAITLVVNSIATLCIELLQNRHHH